MPSGEVMPSGVGALPKTCAGAEPQLSKIIAAAIIAKRVMLASCPRTLWILDFGDASPAEGPAPFYACWFWRCVGLRGPYVGLLAVRVPARRE
jgi:hypothetical protein